MTPIAPPICWLASCVARWHAGSSAPWLSRSGDTVAAHGARMAALALRIWPDASRSLIAACITHDLGEYAAGDAPAHAKRDATLAATLDRIEGQALEAMGMAIPLHAPDARRLKFLDRLDAYLWAQHNAPQIIARDDWRADRDWLDSEARAIGVELEGI
jgi:5'-deoxynucleotidase YfbR-like HD superfamily hydrolase